MKLGWPIEVAGTGICVPERVRTNADLAKQVDTSDEWIVQRTGIRERRIVAEGESTLSLATRASRMALEEAQLDPKDVDQIVLGTITPEHTLPSTACELQAALGCRWIPAFDMAAACSGFVWSLLNAAMHIQTGMANNVLVVGAETLTAITDDQDRSTCVLFGDGAGAAVLRRTEHPERRLLAAQMGADGARGLLIFVPAGGSKEPASQRTIDERLHYMRMQGREVYRFAVTQMQETIATTLEDAGYTPEDLALVIPHQSNLRIIQSAVDKLHLPPEKVMINIDRYGNTSAASVPIAFHEARAQGRVKRGDLVMLIAFGAGLTWGSALLRL